MPSKKNSVEFCKTRRQNCSFGVEFSKLVVKTAVLVTSFEIFFFFGGEFLDDVPFCDFRVRKVFLTTFCVRAASDVKVDLESGLATLNFGGEDEALVKAIFDGSGKVSNVLQSEGESRDVTLRVEGMTCMNCVGRVTKSLEAVPSATNVEVFLETGLATLQFGGLIDELVRAIKDGAGKKAFLVTPDIEQLTELSLTSPMPSPNVEAPNVFPFDDEFLNSANLKPERVTSETQLLTTQLRVSGMTCSTCVGVVEGLLSKTKGVFSARVNLLAGRATVTHDGDTVQAAALADSVSSSGYKCLVLETIDPSKKERDSSGGSQQFRIEFPTNMQAQNALKVLRYMEGVSSAEVMSCTASVTLVPDFSKSRVLRVLETDGSFGKLILRQSLEAEQKALARGENLGATEVIDEEARMWRNRFFTSLSFFIPIVVTGLIHSHTSLLPMRMLQWIHFGLATPVQFGCGGGFYRASYYALKKKRATMDVLVALSTSIAYFSSVVVVFFGLGVAGNVSLGHAVMFKVSAMIITMVLVGKWLEASAKRRAAAGVAALSALTPESAVLFDVKDDASCHTNVAVSALDVGDVVRLIPGDRVPVDGDVIDGVSAVDESMLTGESNPVPKAEGDSVYGGTVNGGGSMLVRTTAVGADAVLSQIVKLVNDAQTSRAPVEAFADRVSAIFVPAVVGISMLVFIVWYCAAVFNWIPQDWYASEGRFFFALLFALETMVIACPCALGLATPTAVMVASEVGTRLGVLFRGGGAAIEAAVNVRTVLFDKTGTLTMGSPEVAAVMVGEKGAAKTPQAAVILSDLVYLVESQSHHPLAGAITRHIVASSKTQSGLNRPAFKISSIEEIPGRGIKASINNGEYKMRIGSTDFAFDGCAAESVLTEAEMRTAERMGQEDGLTLVAAVVNEKLVCMYGLEDTIRPEAHDVVQHLHKMGIKTGLVTGDSTESGGAVAERTGIAGHCVTARALPWTKVRVVEEEEPCCFVGDGINDAPALAASSVGIAIGAGAQVAAESAAVVLVRPDLRGVVHGLDLARTTFRRVRLNFIWAIGYNIVGIPLAAGILYPWFGVRVPPFVASGAMALSSTCVILSSLGLRLYKAPKVGDVTVRDVERGVEMRERRMGRGDFILAEEEDFGSVSSSPSSSLNAPLLGSAV